MTALKFRLGCLACAGAVLAAGGVVFGKSPGQEPDVAGVAIDPDLGFEADPVQIPQGSVAGLETDCELIGDFVSPFQFANRYRGNLYRITESGVFLKEIKMELAFSGLADLFVSVHRRDPVEGTYKQVDINAPFASGLKHIEILGAEGLGDAIPAFYTTGLIGGGLGVELEPGDYAIAFSWGAFSVKYGRDSGVAYPRDFSVGSVRGSITVDLIEGEPPMRDNLPAPTLFSGGAYAMQLCFVPAPGACCDSLSQSCIEVFESQCTAPGSFFHGQRTLCKETICEFGACCFECGNAVENYAAKCGDLYTEDSCNRDGGVNFWTGVSCPADDAQLCPKVTGACCNTSTGACDEFCAAQCIAPRAFRGIGTDCDEFTHLCQGACCVSGGCLNRSPSACAGFQGEFRGDGTRCELLSPEEDCGGACCYGFTGLDFCQVVQSRTLCAFEPGGFGQIVYRGDGTPCPDDCEPGIGDPPTGGCCLPEGQCINTTQNFCLATWVKGTWLGTSARCETTGYATCLGLPRRCCIDDGSCLVLTNQGNLTDPRGACQVRDGIPVAGETTCSVDACTSFAGACCGTAAGTCNMRTPSECAAVSGIYQGDETDCASPFSICPGFGACCRGNGECFNGFTPAECATVSGSYQGDGSTCASPQVDCETRGACCAVTGTCLLTTAGTCAGIGGQFNGVGEPCGLNICPSGACCVGEECLRRTPDGCLVAQGEYQGNDTTCDLDVCSPPGGCCRGDVCTVEEIATCVDGGVFLGPGTACGEDACALGACCRTAGNCQDGVLQGACAEVGEVFHPAGLCSEGIQCVPSGACCLGLKCSVVEQAACPGTYLGNGTECTAETCAPTGACCNGTLCAVVTENACAGGGGEYKGDNVACAMDTCPAPQLCTMITATSPANCSIDARSTNMGSPGAEPWSFIDLTFDCDTAGHAPANYTVRVDPPGAGVPPSIPTVAPNGTTIRLNLSGPIPAGAWTCFKYVPANIERCVGFLPADTNSNRTSTPSDILDLIDHLNGARVPPLLTHQCDIDRSTACGPADILTEIDLLNGASGFAPWNGVTLPECPTP